MTDSWRFSWVQSRYVPDPEDPDAIDVTGFGDPVRSFTSLRDPSPAELAEFRRAWLSMQQDEPVVRSLLPVTGAREPPRAEGPRRGQCQGCGTDDTVDIWSRCAYCAELAALKARNLPGPRLNGWWMTVPAALALALLTALCYAVASVILAG